MFLVFILTQIFQLKNFLRSAQEGFALGSPLGTWPHSGHIPSPAGKFSFALFCTSIIDDNIVQLKILG